MKNEMIVTFEKEYVQVISNGEKDYKFAKKLLSSMIKVCQENECFKVLGIGNTKRTPSTLVGFKYNEIFRELGINHKYQIAWVELNTEFNEYYRFIETVMKNRGLPGEVFTDIEEAKAWLLNDV
jgi:hypothetical protein